MDTTFFPQNGQQGTSCIDSETLRIDQALRTIAEGTAATTGAFFFIALVQHLALALNVRIALVAEVIDDRVRTLALWNENALGDTLEYALAGTPCESVIQRKALGHYPQNVQSLFPDDQILADFGADSYLGCPILGTNGVALGHLVVMDDKPLQNADVYITILKLFAARAGAELERQRVEAKLRASEEQFRSLIENSSDGIAIFDRQGAVRYVSPGLTRIVGWEAPELLGQTWHELAHPDDLPHTRDVFHQLFEHPGQAIVHESRFRHKDGSWRVMEVVAKLHPNGRVVANSRDITERKQAEEKLRESEERFRALVEASPVGIVLVSPEGTIRYVSPAYARFSGYEADDLAGQLILSLVHPDDMGRVASLFADVLQNPDRIIMAEYQHLGKDGAIRIAEATGKVLPNGDVVGFVRDITERKRREEALRLAERRYRAMFDQPLLSVQVFAADGQVLQWNEAYAQLWDVNTPEHIQQLQRYNVLDDPALVPFDVAVLATKLLAGEAAPIPPTYYNPPVHGGLGRARWVQGFVYPVKDDAGVLREVITLTQDITAQKEAEDQLRHLNEELEQRVAERTAQLEAAFAERTRLAEILDATSDMVGFATMEGQTLYINRAGRHMIGAPADCDVTTLNFADIYPPDVLEVFANAAIPTAMRDGTWSGEVSIKHSDGHLIPVSIVGIIHFGTDGAPTHLSAIIRDISEQKRVEAELRQSEERFRVIAETSPIPVAITRLADGLILFANPALCDLVALPNEQVIGRRSPDFWYDPEARQNFADDLKSQGFVRNFEFHAKRADGTPFWAAVSAQVLTFAGQEALLAALYDISNLKEAQTELQQAKEAAEKALAESRRLAAIIEATSDYVGISDLEGQMQYLNRAGRAMVGITAQSSIHAFHMGDFLSSQVLAMLQTWIANNLAKHVDVDLLEASLQHRDGHQIPASIVGIIHRNAVGAPESLSAVIRDISEQKRAEIELKQAKEAAENANKAKSTFLANMSHEIRTPMNAVIGMTSLLLNTTLDEKQRDFVETIRSSGDALLTIINDILDFSKIEAGKLDLERQPLDLRSCIESALDLLAPRADEKGVDLAYELGDDVPGGIVGDITRLRQILVNLVGNAIKFTEHGEVVVSVGLETGGLRLKSENRSSLKPQASSIIFSVKDTGIGIPPDKLGRLFQSFTQIDASTTREYGGTGLGLAISKRLAELMGGTMWAESPGVGLGATFHFTIEAPAAPAPVRSHLRSRQPVLTGKRLLIVDDHPTNRRILSLQAQTWGMECVAAASPQAALALLREGQRFDLAVLDMHMPEMDGAALAVELCAEHARQGRHFPLVLLTSLGYEMHPKLAAVECFAAYLTKPVKPSQLYDVLISVLVEGDRTAQRPPAPARATETRPAVLAERLPLRILLAEDVAVNQKFALLALEELGYSADVAANGREALAALQRQPYDIILMDVQMPELDGLEATRRIRSEFRAERQPHIIAMTANAMQGDRELCLDAGMDDYISKPVYLDELSAALERAAQRAATVEPALIDQAMVGQVLGRRMGRDLIALYLAETEQLLDEFATAVAQRDTASAQRLAHGLKSSSRYIGAIAMVGLSQALEAALRDGALERAPQLVAELQQIFERTREQLLNRIGVP